MAIDAKTSLFFQKCPQFSQKLYASNACMLATFSMSAYLMHISGKFQEYLRHNLSISQAYKANLRHISGISNAYLGNILSNFFFSIKIGDFSGQSKIKMSRHLKHSPHQIFMKQTRTKVQNDQISQLLKSPIFVVQKAAAPKNGVEFRQKSIWAIRCSVVRQRAAVRAVSPPFNHSKVCCGWVYSDRFYQANQLF